jgi:exopolysaccharide biosynthesis operon protein EpsL
LASSNDKNTSLNARKAAPRLARLGGALLLAMLADARGGQIEYQDDLERAIDPPGDLNLKQDNFWDVFGGYHYNHDSNVFRLPDNAAAAALLVGPGSTKGDSINTYSAGGNVQWQYGKQALIVDLRADDNRFVNNTQLNNVATQDRVLLNWGIGPQLTGQVGVDYQRQLASFVNATFYVRDIQDVVNYFAGGRYQLGPHWAVFGGFLGSQTKLSAEQIRGNDSNRKVGDGGVEYYSDAQDSFGADFRYTDATYPNIVFTSADLFYPAYREERIRGFVRYAFTEKTNIDFAAGWLHRDYQSQSVGNFSGPTFRGQLQWLPTDKTAVVAQGWRELHAYLTADTQYFVSTGASVGPRWIPTEKVQISAFGNWEKQDYQGNVIDPTAVLNNAQRRDRLLYGTLFVSYQPIRLLSVEASARHEHRTSNLDQFTYTDTLFSIGFTAKFARP